MTEPDRNPKTRAGGMNKLPFHLIPPRALAHVALCFADGGFKYQPYNWHIEKISSSVYYGAIMRHVFAWWCGESKAKDGHLHLAHAACCMLMLLDVQGTDMLHDNRPLPIGEDFSDLLDNLSAELPGLRDRENTRFGLHDIPTAQPAVPQGSVDKRIRAVLNSGRSGYFLEAVRLFQDITNATLEDANAYVKNMREEERQAAKEEPEEVSNADAEILEILGRRQEGCFWEAIKKYQHVTGCPQWSAVSHIQALQRGMSA